MTLTITDNAATLISHFVKRTAKRRGAGIRIRSGGTVGPSGLDVAVAPAPLTDDQVIEKNGARVFLDERAASYLSTKELDASVADGAVNLTVRDRD